MAEFRCLLAGAVAITLGSAAVADDQARHAACLDAIADNPETAHEDALAWRYQGGGWPAEHCVSLALVALGHERAGGLRLRAAAESEAVMSPASRAILLTQSGDALLAAGEASEAETSFELALEHAPADPGVHARLAQARLDQARFEAAETAASAALALDGDLVEARRIRAEARLAQGDLDGAASDVAAGRALAPEDIPLLLLRGRINEARRTGER